MARILTDTRTWLLALAAFMLLLPALMPSAAGASSAIDQYKESIPNVDGSQEPTSGGPSASTSGPGGSLGSAVGAVKPGSRKAQAIARAERRAKHDQGSGAGSTGEDDEDEFASTPTSSAGAVDSEGVSGWVFALIGLACAAAAVRAAIAIRSRRQV